MSGNNFKAQYKISANGAWQTKISGSEQSCMQTLLTLRNQYSFARVVDGAGRVVS